MDEFTDRLLKESHQVSVFQLTAYDWTNHLIPYLLTALGQTAMSGLLASFRRQPYFQRLEALHLYSLSLAPPGVSVGETSSSVFAGQSFFRQFSARPEFVSVQDFPPATPFHSPSTSLPFVMPDKYVRNV